jgi:hypothetical protein
MSSRIPFLESVRVARGRSRRSPCTQCPALVQPILQTAKRLLAQFPSRLVQLESTHRRAEAVRSKPIEIREPSARFTPSMPPELVFLRSGRI